MVSSQYSSVLKSALFFSSCFVSLQSIAAVDDFSQCVDKLKVTARSEGLSEQTINTSVANLKFIPRVIELDNQQPEFSQTFGNYFNKRVTDWRVKEGRRLLAENRELLNKLTKEYGVPGQYIISFWG